MDEKQTAEVLASIRGLEEQVKTLFRQQEEQRKLTDSVHQLALSVRELTVKQTSIGTDVAGLRKDVDEIKGKPAKRWDALITTALTGAVGVLVGALMALIINK